MTLQSFQKTWSYLLVIGLSAVLLTVYILKPNTSFTHLSRHFELPKIKEVSFESASERSALSKGGHIKIMFESIVDPRSSTIYITNKNTVYNIGDIIQVDIVLKDHGGRRKSRGGDMVRIWIKDLTNRACSAGFVIDNGDGSYRGVIKLLWAGKITIVAGIAASRELMELVSENVRIGRSKRHILGKFENGPLSEIRNCTPLQDVSQRYKNTCNLTYMNSNLPWYCEMPDNVSCKDWKTYAVQYPPMDFSKDEMRLFRSVLSEQQMKTKIHLTVQDGSDRNIRSPHITNHEVTCANLPSETTWIMRTPVGYMYNRRWYSTQCINTFNGSVNAFTKCLRGRKLWLFGDSTTRQFFSFIQKLLNLKLETEKWGSSPWHKPSLMTNVDKTISVFWGTHALPFCNGGNFDSISNAKGTHAYIDEIPAGSRDIIVIHFYLHFMAYDPSVVRIHIRKTVESLKSLKRRAPNVKVVVKGPNAFKTPAGVVGQLYDFWGVVYDRILREEFASVANQVILLDFWDITVAAESSDRHANNTVLVPTIYQMMAYVCP